MKRGIIKGRALLLILLSAALLFAGGCRSDGAVASASRECGIDLTDGEVLETRDTHGGFLGDGETWIVVKLPDRSVMRQMENAPFWHPLPLPENLYRFFTDPFFSEYILEDAENGFWFFYDRHSEAEDPSDPDPLYDRASLNFTFARYDADRGIFTFCRVDT